MAKLHVVIVGGGIVGLSVAYHLVEAGAQVTVVDRDPEGDKASIGNAGGIAVTEVVPASAPGTLWRVFGWMFDPLGPLAVRPSHAPKLIPWLVRFAQVTDPANVERISKALSALNARVYDDLIPMLESLRLTPELYRQGALTVYESEQGYQRDSFDWACRRSRGIITQDLTGDEARRMEPALGPLVHRAIFTPQWSHISDPKRLLTQLRDWLLGRGVSIRRGQVSSVALESPLSVQVGEEWANADRVVVAAGAWSAILAQRLGDRALLESERGYNMTLPRAGVSLSREIIFGERKFVATPLSCGLRIGGAAEFGGLEAPANFRRSEVLVELGRRYLPGLQTQDATPWAGHRPTTPDSLPVISRSVRHAHVFYAFGHGHLGLTQAATTGRLISELIFHRPTAIDVAPYDIARFS
jgi:D-amino-acid dehydrogenase